MQTYTSFPTLRTRWNQFPTIFAALVFVLLGCGGGATPGDDAGPGDGGGDTGYTEYENAAQKGPFEQGGSVSVYRLDERGERTGDELQAEVDEEGRWELDDVDWSDGAVEIVIEGTYFDENDGSFGDDTRTLRAVVAARDGEVDANVNLYTHISAGRIQTLLGDDELEWTVARTQAHTELVEIFGIGSLAENLDILNARGPSPGDSANLLTFSSAAEAAGLGQTELDEMAEDFADDGELDDEGEDHLEEVRAAAFRGGSTMFDRAKQNLVDQYGLEPPRYSNGSGLAWYGDGCVIRTLFNSRLLCEGESVDVPVAANDSDYLELKVGEAGSYAIAMKTDDFSRSRRWTVYSKRESDGSFSGEMGSANSPGTITEDYITSRLSAETPYWVELTNASSTRTVFDVYFYRVSDGKELSPIVLEPGEAHRGVAGTHIGSGGNNDAYYRLEANGTYDIIVEGFVCGGDGSSTRGLGVELALFERKSNDLADPFGGSPVAQSSETGACSQTIEYDLQSNRVYFVRVRNRNFTTPFRPAPIGEDYELHVLEP